jgi:vacuolar-type H+-ATPase subunit H
MNDEPSLLQKIREKEMEMSVQIDSARRESDAFIEQTKREAEALVAGYEKMAETAVAEFHRNKRKLVQEELEQLKIRLEEDERSILNEGEKNIPRARDLIVRRVILE